MVEKDYCQYRGGFKFAGELVHLAPGTIYESIEIELDWISKSTYLKFKEKLEKKKAERAFFKKQEETYNFLLEEKLLKEHEGKIASACKRRVVKKDVEFIELEVWSEAVKEVEEKEEELVEVGEQVVQKKLSELLKKAEPIEEKKKFAFNEDEFPEL